ncbi:MAG: peptide ABC transporter substrate-binding protein, partial [Brucellaceae bacterium]|nr:peptide ABC transporter substrate-binding protein [Brucellaceae bacterium]
MTKTKTLLLATAAAMAAASPALAERGADGEVKIIYWQAPSILNPYLSSGTKDIESASLVIEPLGRYDEKGNLVPYLAAEIPTLENGGVSEDLTTITWKLKEGLKWSDGSPVTSADVAFTAEYCMHPEGGCAQLAKFEGVDKVEAVDDLTVKVTFKEPKPNPYGPFMGGQSPIIQKAQFADCLGTKAPECTTANFNPVGTGPFVVTEFKPNDVITMKANENYRDAAKPAFASLTFKGGGDAAAAGRAVMETGEYDYAWNLQLAPDVLAKMAEAGKGKPIAAFGTLVERIEINWTDASPDLPEGERSTAKHPHPILSDINVRKALSMAIDRNLLVEIGYGQAGRPTCNLVPAPELYASDNTDCLTQDIEGAKKLLDEAGWVPGGDGVRAKDGKRLSLVYQTSTNAVRQDFQALIKQWWTEIG